MLFHNKKAMRDITPHMAREKNVPLVFVSVMVFKDIKDFQKANDVGDSIIALQQKKNWPNRNATWNI